MTHFICNSLFLSASILVAAGITPAVAADTPGLALAPLDHTVASSVSTAPEAGTQPSSWPFSSGSKVDSATLARLRGGTDTVTNDQVLKGTVGSNVASNVATGANTITAGAFANVAGIPIVIQNSGANVLIQNATIINLQMQ